MSFFQQLYLYFYPNYILETPIEYELIKDNKTFREGLQFSLLNTREEMMVKLRTIYKNQKIILGHRTCFLDPMEYKLIGCWDYTIELDSEMNVDGNINCEIIVDGSNIYGTYNYSIDVSEQIQSPPEYNESVSITDMFLNIWYGIIDKNRIPLLEYDNPYIYSSAPEELKNMSN